METETAGPTPALAHGQRITPEIATEVVTAAWADQEAVLLRIVPDWNAASSVKARMASTAAFAPHLEIIDFFTRRLDGGPIGLYVGARRG